MRRSPPLWEIPFSAETKRVLQFAAEEADRRCCTTTSGTEHLLLGILREERSVAASILMEKRDAPERGAREDIVQLPERRKTTLTRVKETPLLAEFSRDLTESGDEKPARSVYWSAAITKVERVQRVPVPPAPRTTPCSSV